MTQLWTEIAFWWLRLAFAGGLLLLAGYLFTAACRQPVRRLRVSVWTLAIALLLLPFTLLPGWLTIPVPALGANTTATAPVKSNAPAAVATAPHEAPVTAVAPNPIPMDVDGELAFENQVPPSAEPAPVQPKLDRPVDGAPAAVVALPGSIPAKSSISRFGPWAVNLLLLGYGAIVFLLIGRLALGQSQLERIWRSSRRAPLEVRQLFDRLTRHFRCRPALRISDRVASPICFGVVRPRVVLPTALAQVADARTLQWIFAHELSHLERRDPLAGWLIGLAQSMFFFWPWFWNLRREVRLNQEFLADASAVKLSKPTDGNAQAVDYADFLVRLTSAGAIPLSAAGVKTPSSDLYRRITMLLQKSGNVESSCPRRWSLAAGFGLLSLGLILAGFSLSAKADPAPAKEADQPKKESVDEIEQEVQKALEALRKGPVTPPRKEAEAEAPARPQDELGKAAEQMKKAKEAYTDKPTDENRQALEKAIRNFRDVQQRNQAGRRFAPQPFPQFQFPGIQPIDPADMKEFQRAVEEMQRQMMEQMQQMQVVPGFPGGGFFPGNGLRFGMDPRGRVMGRQNVNMRLGIRIERPSPVLTEQLDLPAKKGIVVTDVVPDSAAAKGGIKANDIILEIGGKSVASDAMELQNLMDEIKPDQKVDVLVLRKGKKETLKGVELPQPREPENPFRAGKNLRLQLAPQGLQGGDNVRQSIQIVNGEFTIKLSENGIDYTVIGNTVDGAAKATSITIVDDGVTTKTDALDKVSKKYRATVERILNSVR